MTIKEAIRDLNGLLIVLHDSKAVHRIVPDIIELLEGLEETTLEYMVIAAHGVEIVEFPNWQDAIDYSEKQAITLYGYARDDLYWSGGCLRVKSGRHDLFRLKLITKVV